MEAAWFICHACGQRYDQGGFCAHDGQPLAMTDDPLLGTDIGRYRLARLLGEGGMGRVYLAIQPAIGSRVAVKILSDQCARNPELLERFFAEARAVNLINHERIVSVIDLAQLPDGRPFIVMEYVEGHTLASIAAAGPVPLGGIVQVMSEVLSALAAAHAIGIVHRDLKPDNILITAEGHAKVLDFGIAKLAPELQQQLSPRTRTGALLGTPQYMAPEQISGSGGVDARTDIYAAGVVVYELATGQPPFVGETLFDLMRAHLEQPPRPPRALRPDLPAALEHVILTALAKAPGARFPSAHAMAEALQHAGAALPATAWRSLSLRARAGAPGPATGSQAGRPTRPAGAAPTVEGSGRIGLVIGGVVIAALAVAITLFVVLRRGAPTVSVNEPGDSKAPFGETSPAGALAPGADSTPDRHSQPRGEPPSGSEAARGDSRVGDSKVGDSKVGDSRVGDSKVGDSKVGDSKVGDSEVGDSRVGDSKVGDSKVGDSKVGDSRVGDSRVGDKLGNSRVGDSKVGDSRVGDKLGDSRVGDSKVGDSRVGDKLGDSKVGDSKLGDSKLGDSKVGDSKLGDSKRGDPKLGDSRVGESRPPDAANAQRKASAAGQPARGAASQLAGAPAAQGPTIVGGGSAADHGVIIGPGVVTGPGVIIGSQTPAPPSPGPTALTRPADYDPRRFDPVAYLPKAQKLARELLPDAQLTTFEFDPVFPDGHVDLTMDGRDRGYDFRSPARSAFPAGRPRNLPLERMCRVMVELGVRTVSARVVSSDACDDRLIRAPRCSFASVWKQALARGVQPDLVARIGWLFDETWFFDTDLAGKGGGVSSFADRCP
jgi:predicted Ser/Thr protein kinase